MRTSPPVVDVKADGSYDNGASQFVNIVIYDCVSCNMLRVPSLCSLPDAPLSFFQLTDNELA